MSKATKPCLSCPAAAAEKASTPKGNKIKFVLEDTLPTSSDTVIKVKNFKKFLDYDLKTLNITGELQTYTHRNGFTHIKMAVTYQDKTTNKVNYLELDFLDNTKKEENKNTVGEHGLKCPQGECAGLLSCYTNCPSIGVVTVATYTQGAGLKSSKVSLAGRPAELSFDANGVGVLTIAPTL